MRDDPLAPARGIVNGLLIMAVFYAVAYYVFRRVF